MLTQLKQKFREYGNYGNAQTSRGIKIVSDPPEEMLQYLFLQAWAQLWQNVFWF